MAADPLQSDPGLPDAVRAELWRSRRTVAVVDMASGTVSAAIAAMGRLVVGHSAGMAQMGGLCAAQTQVCIYENSSLY